MAKNRYEAKSLGGPVFGIRVIETIETLDGKDVEVLGESCKIQIAVAKKQVVDAETKLENAKAVLAAIGVAAKVAAKEAADALEKETAGE